MGLRDDPGAPSPRDAFPSTRWSRILAGGGAERRPDWEALAAAYLRPIREWLRCRLRDADEAAEAAQEFFVWMMETDLPARADPARGRFRAFLKAALRNFVVDRERRRRSLKRGGGVETAPLEAGGPEPAAGAPEANPDAALDAAWRAALVERALADLDRELRAAGKEAHLRVFREYYVDGDADVDHAAVAARHGIRLTDVSNHLRAAKARFRAILRREILATVGGPEELDEELRWIFEETGA
jgi:RNA polymerase sigma-70 factor (ECF subfamily)